MNEKKQFYISVDGTRVEVTKDIYLTYYRSKRRDRYYELDIKIERAVRNIDGKIIGYAPSKEDSLDRLIDTGEDFINENKSVEDTVIHNLITDALHKALDKLPEPDRLLINALYFQDMTERQAGEVFGLSQKGINKRKTKIIAKLKNFLDC
jgi:RNA polymerase sigma factor (sigma-70 family)